MSKLETIGIEKIEPVAGSDKYIIRTKDNEIHRLGRTTPNARFLIKVDDVPVSTCSKNYTLVDNGALLKRVENVMDNLGIEWVGFTLKHPKPYQMVATYKLEEDVSPFPGKTEDKYDYGLTITNSYDLSMGIYALTQYTRLICTNGLYVTEVESKRRMAHLAIGANPSGVYARLEKIVPDVLKNRANEIRRMEAMSSYPISKEEVEIVLNRLSFRKYEVEEIKGQGIIAKYEERKVEVMHVKVGMDGYQFLNAITATANSVKTQRRQFDLQSQAMGIIEQTIHR